MGLTDLHGQGNPSRDIPIDAFAVHISSGCQMGTDPVTSVLNKYGQTWDYQNVFAGEEVPPLHATFYDGSFWHGTEHEDYSEDY